MNESRRIPPPAPSVLLMIACLATPTVVTAQQTLTRIDFVDSSVLWRTVPNSIDGAGRDIEPAVPAGVALLSNGTAYLLVRNDPSLSLVDSPAGHIVELGSSGGTWLEQASSPVAVRQGQSLRADGDTLWAIDEASRRVYALDSGGRVLRVIGAAASGGTPSGRGFQRPTDVAVTPDRQMFVVDGSEIVTVDPSGTWASIQPEDEPATADLRSIVFVPGEGEDGPGRLFVGDVGNRGIHVLSVDTDGSTTGLDYFEFPPTEPPPLMTRPASGTGAQGPPDEHGGPRAMCAAPGGQALFVTDGHFIYRTRLPLTETSTWEMGGRPGWGPGEFGWAGGIACDTNQIVIVSEELNGRLQRIDFPVLPGG